MGNWGGWIPVAIDNQLKINDIVMIKHISGQKSLYTPDWCSNWKGKVIRLNKYSVTVEFQDDSGPVKRYIDYQDLLIQRGEEWIRYKVE